MFPDTAECAPACIFPLFKFNRLRNGFKLDMELEVAMVEEEIQEFFTANTLAEQIDALVDTSYVYEGTRIKALFNGFTIDEGFTKWVENSIEYMVNVLVERVGGYEQAHEIHNRAYKIVCDINAMKISKLDENGKVMKQKDLPDATNAIAHMLVEDYHISLEEQIL